MRNGQLGGGGGSGGGYKPSIIQELQFKNHMKARRFCQKKFKMFTPFAPQNAMSFTIRMEESSGIVSLISPRLVNSVNLPMLNFSPLQEKLCGMEKEEWGIDRYGLMKGMIKLRSRDQEAHIAQLEEESLTLNEEAFIDGEQKSCEQKIYLLGLQNTTYTTGMGKRLLNRCYSKSLCDKPTGFNMLQTSSMSSATSVSGFGNQTTTKTCRSSHLQVTTRFLIPLKNIQDVDISISRIPVFREVNVVGCNDPSSVIDKRVSAERI